MILDIDLLQKLREADVCCNACGTKYGTYRAGTSTFWMDDCDVCGQHLAVTETRDYGYLNRGIREVAERLASKLNTEPPN